MAAATMFFVCVMDVESGCGLPWRMWMECVAMCVDGCVERVCPRELCGVRFEVRGVHASGLSSMCPSVYAMLWSVVVLWAWFLPLYGGARVGRLYLVGRLDCCQIKDQNFEAKTRNRVDVGGGLWTVFVAAALAAPTRNQPAPLYHTLHL